MVRGQNIRNFSYFRRAERFLCPFAVFMLTSDKPVSKDHYICCFKGFQMLSGVFRSFIFYPINPPLCLF